MVRGRIGRRRVGGSPSNVGRAIVGRDGGCPKHANGLILPTGRGRRRPGAIGVLDRAFAGGGRMVSVMLLRVVIARSTAADLRHGQSNPPGPAGQVGRRFSTGRCRAPSAVSRHVVTRLLRRRLRVVSPDGRERGIVVGVETVLLHFFPSFFLGGFLSLPLAEEVQGSQDDHGHRHHGHYDGDRDGATGRQTRLRGGINGARLCPPGALRPCVAC